MIAARLPACLNRAHLTALLWLLAPPGLLPTAQAQVELHGPAELVSLIQPHLPADDAAPRQLRKLVSEILATEGYFSPQLQFGRLDPPAQADAAQAHQPMDRLDITPGARTHIATLKLRIDGPISAERRQQLQQGWKLPPGQAFRQDDWNSAKQALLSALMAEDHPAAQLIASQADIDVAGQAAHLSLHYVSGPPYLYGGLIIDGLHRYPASLIARYNRKLQPGRPYREAELNQFQAELQASPYFSHVNVRLEHPATSQAETVIAPIHVSVQERPAHKISLGAGISSNTGVRAEFSYATPNFANQAWLLNSGLRLEQRQQTVYGDVFLPPDGGNHRWSLGAMAENSDIQGLHTSGQAVGVQRLSRHEHNDHRLSLNWLQEQRVPDGVAARTNHALVAGMSWTWRQIDSLIDPRRGTVLQAQVAGAYKALLSDTNFFQLSARLQHYRPLSAANHLLLRLEAGHTRAGAGERIPQDYLFRAGGAGSVRGYSYQSLGIREGQAIVGGRVLGIASAELTHWFDEHWGLAGFIDSGDVSNAWSEFRPALGYGLGGRWRSPAGPLGIDLAYGQRSHSLQLHFSLFLPF